VVSGFGVQAQGHGRADSREVAWEWIEVFGKGFAKRDSGMFGQPSR
jgi:hypothetical protein